MDKHIINIELDLKKFDKQLEVIRKKLSAMGTDFNTNTSTIGKMNVASNNLSGSLNKVSSAAGTTGVAISTTGKAANVFFNTVKNIGIGALKAFRNVLIGTGIAIYGLNKSIDILIPGLEKMLQMRSVGPYMRLANEINGATRGIIDLNSAINIAQRSGGIFRNEDVVNMSKYVATLRLMRSDAFDVFDITQKLIKAQEKGMLDEETRKILGGQTVDRLNKILKIENKSIRNKKYMRAIEEESLKIQKESGDVLNSNMSKFLGIMKAIQDESTGVFQVLKGFGAAAASLFGPLGAGLASFRSGAFSGIIGTSLGLLTSGVMTASVIKVLHAFGSGLEEEGVKKGKSINKVFNSLTKFLNMGLEVFTGSILGETKKREIGEMTEDELKQLQSKGETLKQVRQKIVGWLEYFRDVGKFLSIFSTEFFEKLNLNKYVSKLKKIKDLIVGKSGANINDLATKVGGWLGTITDKVITKILDLSEKVASGKTLKSFNESVFGTIFNFFTSLMNFIDKISNDPAFKKISKLIDTNSTIKILIKILDETLKLITKSFDVMTNKMDEIDKIQWGKKPTSTQPVYPNEGEPEEPDYEYPGQPIDRDPTMGKPVIGPMRVYDPMDIIRKKGKGKTSSVPEQQTSEKVNIIDITDFIRKQNKIFEEQNRKFEMMVAGIGEMTDSLAKIAGNI